MHTSADSVLWSMDPQLIDDIPLYLSQNHISQMVRELVGIHIQQFNRTMLLGSLPGTYIDQLSCWCELLLLFERVFIKARN